MDEHDRDPRYRKMTDAEFWAHVREILDVVHDSVQGVADYVHDEAQHRVPELADLHRRKLNLLTEQRTAYDAAHPTKNIFETFDGLMDEPLPDGYKDLDRAYDALFLRLSRV